MPRRHSYRDRYGRQGEELVPSEVTDYDGTSWTHYAGCRGPGLLNRRTIRGKAIEPRPQGNIHCLVLMEELGRARNRWLYPGPADLCHGADSARYDVSCPVWRDVLDIHCKCHGSSTCPGEVRRR